MALEPSAIKSPLTMTLLLKSSVWETFFLCQGGCLARSGRISCLNQFCILFLTKSKYFLFISRDLLIWTIAFVSLTLIVDFFLE